MKSAAAIQPKPDPPQEAAISPSPEFIAARERWQALRAEMRVLNRRREDQQTAVFLANYQITPPTERMKAAAATVDPDLLANVKRFPRRAELELAEIIETILEFQPRYEREHQAFERARRAEALRIAELFRDRHRETIRKLAKALESFNDAIEAERSVRRDFAAASPEPTSSALPDLSGDFADLDLADWHSTGATWARRIQAGLT